MLIKGIKLFGVILALASGAIAQVPSGSVLLVISKIDHVLAVVDPVTLKVLARVPVGLDPHEVVTSADGTTAYVSNYGTGTYNTITRVDLVADKPLAPIDLGALRGPHGLQFVGGELWFTAEGAKAIGRYDPSSGKIDWVMGTGQDKTHMLHVREDKQFIAATNVESGTVSILEEFPRHKERAMTSLPPDLQARLKQIGMPNAPPTEWRETVIPVGNGSEGFDVAPNGESMWVANAQDGSVSVINLMTKHVDATLLLNAKGLNRLKFTTDGKSVLVSTLGGPDLIILDVSSRKILKRLPIGHGAAGILMEPDGLKAFVACSPDDYVAVIDLQTLEVVGRISAGGEPDGLAWASNARAR